KEEARHILDQAKEEAVQLKREHQSLESKINLQKSQLEKLTLDCQNAQAQYDLKAATLELDSKKLESQLSEKQAEMAKLEEQHITLRSEHQKLQEDYEQAQNLCASLDTLKDQLDERAASLKMLDDQIKEK